MVAINQTQIIYLHINFDFSKNQSEIVFFRLFLQYNITGLLNTINPHKQKIPRLVT